MHPDCFTVSPESRVRHVKIRPWAGDRHRILRRSGRGRIDLWLAECAHLAGGAEPADEAVGPGGVAWLPTDERRAAQTLHFAADRRAAFATRVLQRTTLSRYQAVSPAAWQFAQLRHGRPEIAAPAGTGLRFNLSQTRDFAVCAVTQATDLGVDIERMVPLPDLADVAAATLAPRELAAFAALPEADRTARFYAAWTLKEAWLKACGHGLSRSLHSVAFDFVAGGRLGVDFAAVTGEEPRGWWFALFDIGQEHLLALAARQPAACAGLEILRLVPALGDSHRQEVRMLACSAEGGR